jgi:hypothetical protein
LPDRSGLSLRVRATDPVKGLGQTFSSRCQKSRNRPTADANSVHVCGRFGRPDADTGGLRSRDLGLVGANPSARSAFGARTDIMTNRLASPRA